MQCHTINPIEKAKKLLHEYEMLIFFSFKFQNQLWNKIQETIIQINKTQLNDHLISPLCINFLLISVNHNKREHCQIQAF